MVRLVEDTVLAVLERGGCILLNQREDLHLGNLDCRDEGLALVHGVERGNRQDTVADLLATEVLREVARVSEHHGRELLRRVVHFFRLALRERDAATGLVLVHVHRIVLFADALHRRVVHRAAEHLAKLGVRQLRLPGQKSGDVRAEETVAAVEHDRHVRLALRDGVGHDLKGHAELDQRDFHEGRAEVNAHDRRLGARREEGEGPEGPHRRARHLLVPASGGLGGEPSYSKSPRSTCKNSECYL
mmetsp:Transcript_64309/g.178019  ORF Transcript_64309/g.178019 Transcript_64309/m.178019 type:complete len:245 (-) Transcript_64309:53-787(-)